MTDTSGPFCVEVNVIPAGDDGRTPVPFHHAFLWKAETGEPGCTRHPREDRRHWWTAYRVSESSTKYDECSKHRDRQTWLVDGGSPGDTHMMVLRGRTNRRCNEGDEGWNRPSSQGFLVLCPRNYLRYVFTLGNKSRGGDPRLRKWDRLFCSSPTPRACQCADIPSRSLRTRIQPQYAKVGFPPNSNLKKFHTFFSYMARRPSSLSEMNHLTY